MKYFAVFCIMAVSSAIAMPAPDEHNWRFLPALHHEEVHDQFGQFALRYVTAEGTVVSQKGHLVPLPDGSGHVLAMEGEITHIGPEGKTYTTKYSSGLDGYHVEGDHLPKAPEPIPV